MPDKLFLETYPLYRKAQICVSNVMNHIPKPQINAVCKKCDGIQTYAMENNYYDGRPHANFQSGNQVVNSRYVCLGCEDDRRNYAILISRKLDWIMKVGQNPPWEIKGDKNIETMLDGHKNYLAKGMISESQGYGIGAFAYYRRITEEIIDQLLEDMSNMIPASEVERYAEAMGKVKTTRQASEKIQLVKDMLPSSLLSNGMNPLGVLHSALSEGLHAQTDDDCMTNAEIVREALIFLSAQISSFKQSQNGFNDRIKKLLDKKSKTPSGDA